MSLLQLHSGEDDRPGKDSILQVGEGRMTGHTTEVSIVVVAVQSRQDAHNNIYLSRYRHRYI